MSDEPEYEFEDTDQQIAFLESRIDELKKLAEHRAAALRKLAVEDSYQDIRGPIRCRRCGSSWDPGKPSRHKEDCPTHIAVSALSPTTVDARDVTINRDELEKLRERLMMAEAKAAVIGGEACAEERAAGNGPCGACAWCCAQARERLERIEQVFRDGDRAAEMAHEGDSQPCPYPADDSLDYHWWTRGFAYKQRLLRAADVEIALKRVEEENTKIRSTLDHIEDVTLPGGLTRIRELEQERAQLQQKIDRIEHIVTHTVTTGPEHTEIMRAIYPGKGRPDSGTTRIRMIEETDPETGERRFVQEEPVPQAQSQPAPAKPEPVRCGQATTCSSYTLGTPCWVTCQKYQPAPPPSRVSELQATVSAHAARLAAERKARHEEMRAYADQMAAARLPVYTRRQDETWDRSNYDAIRSTAWHEMRVGHGRLAYLSCDHCGSRVWTPDDSLASHPPKQTLKCPGCGWIGYARAGTVP